MQDSIGLTHGTDNLSSPHVHPVFIVAVGTTMIELLPTLRAHLAGVRDLVPWRAVAIDSLPYDDVVKRLQHQGWSQPQITATLPRAQFFHLASPFSREFDFTHPLNHPWQPTIHEPALRQLALTPDAPGCAGTPALGRARAEGQEAELHRFFDRHLRDLTQVRTETLALTSGVLAFVITTYRGGTGTGATIPVAAVLRAAMTDGEVHLHAVMPCVYLADPRGYANAYAVLRETQAAHRFGGTVPMLGDPPSARP